MSTQLLAVAFVALITAGVTSDCRRRADVAHGLDRLQHGVYQDPLLCSPVFDALHETWDGPDLEKAKAANNNVDELRAIGRERYGLPVAPYPNDGAPMGFVPKDGWWHMSCLLCHAGHVPSEPPVPTIGVANNRLDLQTLFEDLYAFGLERIAQMCGERTPAPPAAVPSSAKRATQMFGLSFASGHAPAANGIELAAGAPAGAAANAKAAQCYATSTISRARGTTTAFIQSAMLLQERDKDLDRQACQPITGLQDHDLDAPAWWTTARKSRLYSDGFATKGPRPLLQFALAEFATGAMIRGWEGDARDMLAWIDTNRAPAYPWPIDRALAGQGQVIFAARCSQCHGTYGTSSSYPERRASVGTDGLRLVGLSSDFKRRFSDSWLGHYGSGGVELMPTGYVAPPLDGIWATAPYLHNGAVPTLDHLLNSGSRPTVWRVTDFATFDKVRVGLTVSEHVSVPAEATTGSEMRRYVNTGLAGLGNAGHTFGDVLTATERKALIEYLKSL